MGTIDNRELSIISDCIVQLDKRGELSVSSLLDMCRMHEVEVTYNKLQQLNRSKFKGRMPIKILRRDLVEQLQPFGYLEGVHEVLAKVDFPESEEELRSNAVSISLMTPAMLRADTDYFSDSSQLLKIIYTPYCYQFTAFLNGVDESDICYFDQIQKLVKESNGGDDCLWFKGLLYSPKDVIDSADSDALLHGVLEYTEGRSFFDKETKGEAYLLVLREPVPSGVTSFYSIESILNGYDYGAASRAIDAIINPGKSYYSGDNPKESPNEKEKENPNSENPYQVKIYNTGAGNCIYLYPSKVGEYNKRFFFDIGKTMISRFKIDPRTKSLIFNSKDMQRKEVEGALKCISCCQPHFIILSHWDKDHYNLAYRLRQQLSTCPWIAPQIESLYRPLPLNGMRLLKYLCANHLIHFVGPGYINKRISANGVFSLWRGNRAIKHSGKRSYYDRNADCLLLQMSQTLLPADCIYPYWPDDFAKGQSFRHFVVPHHGSYFSNNTKCSSNKILPPRVKVALSQTGKAYICAGMDSKYHPNDLHMEGINKQLCASASDWTQNSNIQSTSRLLKDTDFFIVWDDT